MSLSLATYLYGAHLLHIPLILAGPGSEDIADAMAITFYSRTAGKLTFKGEVDDQSIDNCLQDDDELVTIINPFNTNWAYKLPELLRNPTKYFVMATPYPEELLMEPKSLYNLALPVLTDVLVGDEAHGDYIAAEKLISGKEQKNSYENWTHRRVPLLRSLSISSFARTYVQKIYNYFSQNWQDNPDDFFFIYGLLPLAYSLGKLDIVKEQIQEGRYQLSKTNNELLKPYLGD